jgi:hypothetical protein
VAAEVAEFINSESSPRVASSTLEEFLYPGRPSAFVVSPRSVGKQLKGHLDNPVKSGDRTLVLRTSPKTSVKGSLAYFVHAEETGDE